MESSNFKTKYLKYKAKYFSLKNKLDSNNIKIGKIINMNGGNLSQNELILFKAEWCPHCKTFSAEWEKLQNELTDFKFTKIDDSQKEILEKYNKMDFNIKGYPTLFLAKDGRYLEYMGPMEKDKIVNFVNSI